MARRAANDQAKHLLTVREPELSDREATGFRVMRVIAANPHYTQRDIAREVGASLGAVNYCLNALIEVGFVKAKNFRAADNKLRYAYLLTPRGVREKTKLTGAFLQRKMREYEALKAEIEALTQEEGEPLGTPGRSHGGGR